MPIQLLQVVVFRVYSANPAVLFGPLCPSNGGTGHFVTLRFLRTEGMHVPESSVFVTAQQAFSRSVESAVCAPFFAGVFGTRQKLSCRQWVSLKSTARSPVECKGDFATITSVRSHRAVHVRDTRRHSRRMSTSFCRHSPVCENRSVFSIGLAFAAPILKVNFREPGRSESNSGGRLTSSCSWPTVAFDGILAICGRCGFAGSLSAMTSQRATMSGEIPSSIGTPM